MGDIHDLAVMKEQDQLNQFRVRTDKGEYVSHIAAFWVHGVRHVAHSEQDMIPEKFLRTGANYYPLQGVEKIEKGVMPVCKPTFFEQIYALLGWS